MSRVTIPQPDLEHDKILVFWKIGDQSIHGARDFELLGYIDPDEWTMDGQPVISDHMASVYGIALVTKDFKSVIQEKVEMNNEWKSSGCDIYDTVWRDVNTDFSVWTTATSGSDLYEKIETSAGIEYVSVSAISADEMYYTSAIFTSAVPTSSWEVVGREDQRVQKRWVLDKARMTREGLLDALYAKDVVVPILDGFEVSASPDWIVEKDFTGLDLVEDRNAITSGSYTVGSGGDYTTWSLWEADIATQTGDISGVQISDINQTAHIRPNQELNNFDCIMIGQNYTTTLNSLRIFVETEGPGTFIIDGLNLTTLVIAIAPQNITSACNIEVKNCVIDGLNIGGTGIKNYAYNAILFVYNNVFKDLITTGISLYYDPGFQSSIENNTIINSSIGMDCFNRDANVRNNVCVNNTAYDFYRLATSTKGFNNASSDATADDANWATGEGNLTNINPEAEFKSLDPSSSDFLKPKTYSILNHKGASILTDNTTGISGNDRPHTRT